MKKIKIKDIIASGTLETVTNLYGQTSSNGVVKISYGNIRRLTANLLPIVESEWENGFIDTSGGLISDPSYIRMKNAFPINPARKYILNDLLNGQIVVRLYKIDNTLITNQTGLVRFANSSSDLILSPHADAAYFKIYTNKNGIPPISAKYIYESGLYMTML